MKTRGQQHRIWLTELSTRLSPAVQLDGLDVSFQAAPPPELLPANIAFRKWDIKTDVPDELLGRYDIVHIRNFLFVLLDAEVPTALANLVKLLSTYQLSAAPRLRASERLTRTSLSFRARRSSPMGRAGHGVLAH